MKNTRHTGAYKSAFILIVLGLIIGPASAAFLVNFATSGAPAGQFVFINWQTGDSGGGLYFNSPGPSPGSLEIPEGGFVTYSYPQSLMDPSGHYYLLQSYNHPNPYTPSGDTTIVATYAQAPEANVVFSTSGLPAGIEIAVNGYKTNPVNNVQPFSSTFTSNGPGSAVTTKPGTPISYSFIPSSVTHGGVTYRLAGLSPPGPITTGPSGSTTQVTGQYIGITTTTLTSSSNPSDIGQTVTFTAVVSGSTGQADENVTFMDNGATWPGSQSLALNATGAATITTSHLTVGLHNISAWYSGNATMDPSMGFIASQRVRSHSTTTLVCSANPSCYGDEVKFTAIVRNSTGLAGETVTFRDNGNPWPGSSGIQLDSSGEGSVTVSDLALGLHTITVEYSGNETVAASTSWIDPMVIHARITTPITVTSSKNPSVVGEPVTFTAHVAGRSPYANNGIEVLAAAAVPMDMVQFSDNGVAVGPPVMLDASCKTQYTTAALTVGNHVITARYGGNATWQAGTGELPGGHRVKHVPSVDTAGLFRPSTGNWCFDYNLDGKTDRRFDWMKTGDIPVTGDWTGDGRTGIGVFRPSTGKWFFDYNLDGKTDSTFSWMKTGDIPVTGDWTGDGCTGIGVFRPSIGRWFFDYDLDGKTDTRFSWMKTGDIPVTGDWTGDGRTGIGVFRPSIGRWFFDYDLDGSIDNRIGWAKNGDIPVTGDWNGDGCTGIGVFRPSTGRWIFDYNLDGKTDRRFDWMKTGDIPVTGDWTGDGRTGIGVFRPSTGRWIFDFNLDGKTDRAFKWGMDGDEPLTGHWV